MLNYRISYIEWEIFYKLEIEREILGEIIFDLKETLPDFSSPSEELYIFRNNALKKSLVIDENSITIWFGNLFEENDFSEIITVLKKYIPNETYRMRMRIRTFISNDNKKLLFKPPFNEALKTTVPEAKLRHIGFEITNSEDTYFLNLQLRKDSLELLLNVAIENMEPKIIDDLYQLTESKINQTKDFIENNCPVEFEL